MTESQKPKTKRRWCHLTPARFFLGLLAVQVLLLLSERFQWFWFNEHKGWTVLIAIGVVCVAVLAPRDTAEVCGCTLTASIVSDVRGR
jgi:hypothetical protein